MPAAKPKPKRTPTKAQGKAHGKAQGKASVRAQVVAMPKADAKADAPTLNGIPLRRKSVWAIDTDSPQFRAARKRDAHAPERFHPAGAGAEEFHDVDRIEYRLGHRVKAIAGSIRIT